MRNTLPPSFFPQRGAKSKVTPYSDAIEWEELPSLSDTLDRRLVNPEVGQKRQIVAPSVLGAAWDHTMPADFDNLPPPNPFRETLQGLSTREVYEPDIFRHFFGNDNLKS